MVASHTLALALPVAACAALAAAQGTVTYSWDVNGSGSNTVTIAPGETVELRMYATWEPHDETWFAGSIYDIVGLENWDTGTVTLYDNKLSDLTDDGQLQANGDILVVESFQLPPAFNPNIHDEYPLDLYELHWTPSDYSARTIRVSDANHLNNDVYTDSFGTSVSYQQTPSEGAIIHIIPAPATSALLCGLLVARRRR
jgi:hypothetical protein